jgi:hypothetical protein
MYICIDFGTYVCANCSGIHRNFNRKVKGIGMGEFTDEEVARVKQYGNEVAVFM